MTNGKKSFGSCRGKYTRRDEEQQYLDISVSEAARMIVALQNAVGSIMCNDNRRSESDIRLWIHAPNDKDGEVAITVYKQSE